MVNGLTLGRVENGPLSAVIHQEGSLVCAYIP